MDNKIIYYRPTERDAELLTPSQLKRMHTVWGKCSEKKPYNNTDLREANSGFNTGLNIVVELMATIENTSHLNTRHIQLQERIKKGLTPSKGSNYNFVEQNLLAQIIYDARTSFERQGGDLRQAFGVLPIEEGGPYYFRDGIPMKEFFRIYGLPYYSVMDKVKECETKVGIIPKPTTIHKLKHKYPMSYDGDQSSVFKHYYIKGDLTSKGKFIQTSLPYVCKVYQGYDMDYVQIYVYDLFGRNWAIQNVVDYLVKHELIDLK